MFEFYVTIVGSRQGPFMSEVAGGTHAGKLVGLAYDQSASVAGSSPGSGGRTGKVVLSPVRFTKQWGAASPQLLQALATGEALTTVLFEFMRTTDEGLAEVVHRVRLHDARVVELRPFVDLDAEPSSLMPLPPLEEVALAYAGITLESVPHGTTATAGTARKSRLATAPVAKVPVAKGKVAAKPKPSVRTRR